MWNGGITRSGRGWGSLYESDPARQVRFGIKKTLSFSKCWDLHVARLKLFVHRYNLEIAENILK